MVFNQFGKQQKPANSAEKIRQFLISKFLIFNLIIKRDDKKWIITLT